jgi:RimJ/RimL family protein N-acetyltransferase
MIGIDLFPIHSPRLSLRRFQKKDLLAFVSYRSDPEVARYQSWSYINDDEARDFIREQQHAQFGLPGEWFQIAIAQRQTDILLGDVGICIKGDDSTSAEIGFTLARENQGKGLASEAVRMVVALIFEETEVERIEAITDSRNLASIELLRRMGMRQERTEQVWFKGSQCREYTFVLEKKDWLSKKAV